MYRFPEKLQRDNCIIIWAIILFIPMHIQLPIESQGKWDCVSRGRERGRKRILSRLCIEPRIWCGTQFHDTQIMTWAGTKSQKLYCAPGTPSIYHIFESKHFSCRQHITRSFFKNFFRSFFFLNPAFKSLLWLKCLVHFIHCYCCYLPFYSVSYIFFVSLFLFHKILPY